MRDNAAEGNKPSKLKNNNQWPGAKVYEKRKREREKK